MNSPSLRYFSFILIFCFIALESLVFSQNHTIDSLRLRLQYSEGEKRIEILNSIAKEMTDYNLNSALKYNFEALQIAENLELDKETGFCHKHLGTHYLAKGEISSAQQHLKKALSILSDYNIGNSSCLILNDLGTVYSRMGNFDSALYYHEQAYEWALSNKDTLFKISSLRAIGNVYYKQGNFDQALESFQNGLSHCDYVSQATKEKSHLLNNMGILYSDWGEYSKSLNYYNQALRIMESVGDNFETGRIYNNMGTIYWYKELGDSALYYYNQSLKIREKIGDENGKAYVLNNLGMFHGSAGNFEESITYFKHSLNLFEKLQNRGGTVMSNYNIASVYIELKDFESAIKYHNQSLNIAQEQGFKDYIAANLESLKDIYKEINDWEKAYAALMEYNSISDSIRTEQNIELLKELEIRYENEKNKAELTILQNQMDSSRAKNKQNLLLLSGVLIIIILIVFSTYFIVSQLRIKTSNEFNKITPSLLRYQMNPQFINSSLTGIKELIGKNKIKESGMFLSGFAKLMRTFIETSTSNFIVLEKELDTIRHFFKLHQLRYEHELEYNWEISEKVEVEMLAIPPLILFPTLVHIIDYHLTDGKINIDIFIETQKNHLIFEAKINYFSHSGNKQNDVSDMKNSLTNIKNRIKSINRSLKDDIKFDYQKKQNNNEKKISLRVMFPIKPI